MIAEESEEDIQDLPKSPKKSPKTSPHSLDPKKKKKTKGKLREKNEDNSPPQSPKIVAFTDKDTAVLTPAISIKKKASMYALVTDVTQYVQASVEQQTDTVATTPNRTLLATSHKYNNVPVGRAGVVSQELLARRVKSTRKFEEIKQYTMKGKMGRSATMKGKSNDNSTYVDYTLTPHKAPDPTNPTFQLKRVEGEDRFALTIELMDGNTLKVLVTPNFTSLDVFQSTVSKLDLKQYDCFWLSKPHDDPEDQWLDYNATLSDQDIDSNSRLIFKVKWFKTYFKTTDEKAIYLFYKQMSRMIISGKWPVTNKVITRLSGIEVHLTFKDFVRAKHRPGFFTREELEAFVPKAALDRMNLEYIQSRIFSFHRKLVGMQPPDAYRLYLQIAHESYYWGFTHFQFQQHKLGVAEDGIFIYQNDDDDPLWISYDELRNVSKTDNNSVKIEYTRKKQGGEFIFPSSSERQANTIIELICGYYIILLKQDTVGIRSGTIPKEYRNLPGTPNYMNFMRPKLRIKIEEIIKSMLMIVRDQYVIECQEKNLPPLPRFMLQIENRMDNEEVLDILDVKNCRMTDDMLQCIVNAVEMAYTKQRENEDILVDLAPYYLIFTGNRLTNGELIGKILNLTGAHKADLSQNQLGTQGAKLLAEKIKTNKKLEEIMIGENSIGKEGLQALVEVMKDKKNLKNFNFKKNRLENCQSELLSLFKDNHAVAGLDLSDNPLGDGCVTQILENLKGNSVEFLNLTNVGLTNSSAAHILRFLGEHRRITGLSLGFNKFNPALGTNIASQVVDSNIIQFLDLQSCGIGENGTTAIFASLANNKSLEELNVSGNDTSKKGLALLAKSLTANTTLRKLGLRFCSIDKAGFLELAQGICSNSGLLWLDVSHNNLESREAARRLAESISHKGNRHTPPSKTKITELNLSGCEIEYKQMEELSEGICINTSIEILHLDGNTLAVRGCRALALGVKNNHKLKIVTIQETSIDTTDVIGFMDKVGDDCSLDILDCRKNPGIVTNQEYEAKRKRYNKYKVLTGNQRPG